MKLWKIFVSKLLAASLHHCPPYSIHILYLNEKSDESENEAKPNPNPLTERKMSKTQQFVPYHQMVKIDLLSFSICLVLEKFFLSQYAKSNQVNISQSKRMAKNKCRVTSQDFGRRWVERCTGAQVTACGMPSAHNSNQENRGEQNIHANEKFVEEPKQKQRRKIHDESETHLNLNGIISEETK